MKLGIIDSAGGNVGSVLKAFRKLGLSPVVVSHPSDISSLDSLVLPGVGNFTAQARTICTPAWRSAISQVLNQRFGCLLGICVGMQLLAEAGEEGAAPDCPTPGLSLVYGSVQRLSSAGCRLRLPHVGWNSVRYVREDPLFRGIPSGTDFYFVHSYGVMPCVTNTTIAVVDYEVEITAAVCRDRVWGVQFHPEKSSDAGLALLRNFISQSQC